MGCLAFGSFEINIGVGEIFECIEINIVFVIEAAFEFATLTGKFLWVWRELLYARCAGGYGGEVGERS